MGMEAQPIRGNVKAHQKENVHTPDRQHQHHRHSDRGSGFVAPAEPLEPAQNNSCQSQAALIDRPRLLNKKSTKTGPNGGKRQRLLPSFQGDGELIGQRGFPTILRALPISCCGLLSHTHSHASLRELGETGLTSHCVLRSRS